MRRELRNLIVYLAIMLPLTAAVVWFTWLNASYMLNTSSCERQGTCVSDR